MGSKVANRTKRIRFADKNLQLALLDQVQMSHMWLAAHEADYEEIRGSHPTWPTWSAIRDAEHTHNAALEQYLLTLGLPADPLAKLTSLTLDGDRDLYGWVYSFWWEDGEHFVIKDLAGIHHCSALESLHLHQSIAKGCSLQPLAKLSKLKTLRISVLGDYQDIDALLKLPNLQKLELVDAVESPASAEWDRVTDLLCKAGLPSFSRC